MTRFLLALPLLAATCIFSQAADRPAYLNPTDCVATPDGKRAYVALAGTKSIAAVDLAGKKLSKTWPAGAPPTGLALSPDGKSLAVTLGETAGELALLDALTGKELKRFAVGFSPMSPVFLEDGKSMAICNRFTNSVGIYRIENGEKVAEVPVTREPVTAVATLDGKRLFVGCLLPAQAATSSHVATTIDVIDLGKRELEKCILLPNGSSSLMDLALSPDGRHLFASHVLGHHQVPTNQLERGWMNANAMSVVDTAKAKHLQTVLLDDTTLGAANPWGVGISADGNHLAVAHAGTHELSIIPLKPLMEMVLRGSIKKVDAPANRKNADNDYYSAGGLERELTTMMHAGRVRVKLPGEGPRAVAVTGSTALVCEYFSGNLALVDLAEDGGKRTLPVEISLGKEPKMDVIRRGELRFMDARLCFQQWQSCLSCHPGVRTDALNWDLLNDGIGNPKQTKSLLGSHATPPAMARGVRAKAEVAVRSGIRFIQFAEVDEKDATAIDAFLNSLQPVPSPRLVNGELSELAHRGRVVFKQAGCINCHPVPWYTDQELHRVKHATGLDKGAAFDTPGLVEVWRTGPYLYDGRAVKMSDALRIKSKSAAELSDQDMKALVEYVMSL